MTIGLVAGLAVIGWMAIQGIYEVVTGAGYDGMIPEIGQ